MSIWINKVAVMDKIAKECHYDTEHPLEAYAKLVQVINDMEGVDLKWSKELLQKLNEIKEMEYE